MSRITANTYTGNALPRLFLGHFLGRVLLRISPYGHLQPLIPRRRNRYHCFLEPSFKYEKWKQNIIHRMCHDQSINLLLNMDLQGQKPVRTSQYSLI